MIMNEINETVGLFVLSLIICFVGLFISIKKSNNHEKKSLFDKHQ